MLYAIAFKVTQSPRIQLNSYMRIQRNMLFNIKTPHERTSFERLLLHSVPVKKLCNKITEDNSKCLTKTNLLMYLNTLYLFKLIKVCFFFFSVHFSSHHILRLSFHG